MDIMGEIIFKIREAEGIAQNVLCEGICSASTLSRLEWEGRNISQWLIDALLQRLGKSQDSFWSIINISDYKLMEQRREIWNNILCGDYEKAKKGTKDYEERIKVNSNNLQVHMQFVHECWGMIYGREENNWKAAIGLLTNSITNTVSDFTIEKVKSFLLGRDEIFMILLLAEAYEKSNIPEISKQLLVGLMENMKQKIWDEEEKVKIYPKVVRRYIEVLKKEDKYEEVISLSRDATELLIENGVIFLLVELMECTIWGIQRRIEVEGRRYSVQEKQEYEKLDKNAKLLREIWGKYGEYSEMEMIYCTNIQKDISISNEILVKCRKLCKLSQEQLSERVCTVENLSRIENFKCSPMDRSYRALMEKMNMAKEKNRYIVNAEEYSLHEKVRKVTRYLSRMEYRKAAEEWKIVRDEIPTDTLNNQQYIARYDMIMKYYNGEINCQEVIEGYEEALKITMPEYPDVDISNWPLSRTELSLLSNIAEVYKIKGDLTKTIYIYHKLYQFFEKSHIDVTYRLAEYKMILCNLSLIKTELGQYDEAKKIIKKGIKCCIVSGRISELPYFLYAEACALIEEDFKKTEQKARNILKQAFCLSEILKMPNLSSQILNYYKECWNEECSI